MPITCKCLFQSIALEEEFQVEMKNFSSRKKLAGCHSQPGNGRTQASRSCRDLLPQTMGKKNAVRTTAQKNETRRVRVLCHIAGRSGGRIDAVTKDSSTEDVGCLVLSVVFGRCPCLSCIVRWDASLSDSAVMVIVGKFAPAVGNTELPAT